ncbi:MAG: sensor histidine kinase [Halobacteriota archaeon]
MTRSNLDSLPSPPRGHQRLIENFPNGVAVLFDDDLRYRIVGPETLPFSEREAAAMVGKTVSELFPEATAARLGPELRATIDGESRSFDIEYDGQIHHIETAPVDIDGDSYGVFVTQEVTEVRRTAAELERQNERLDEFASMVSHDLRNPLSIALGRLEQYRETGDDSDLETIGDALIRIEELTADLTTLTRHGALPEDHDALSLSEVARDAWEMIDSRSATLTTEECTVVGDRGQLQALFENLFRNAVGHGGDDVTVRVGPLGDGFYVEDTGSGIPPEVRERVFEHGFTTGYGGSGVGLTIVRRIADAHGFEVSLVDGADGGARFVFDSHTDEE